MISKLQEPPILMWIRAVLLLFLLILSFGIAIPFLGLYADDWPFVYVYEKAGFLGVVDFISWVRPAAGWLFATASALTGTNFWIAHGILFLLRLGDALLFYLLLRMLFPAQDRYAFWSTVLFAIFPAFKQQPLAVEYFPHFVILGFFLASCILMVNAARTSFTPGCSKKRSYFYWFVSWLMCWGMFTVEYFYGQEFLRPLFLWIVLIPVMPEVRKRIKAVLFLWLPYLAVALAFLYWRVFVFKFPSYQPTLISELSTDFSGTVLTLFTRILHDLWTAGVGTWLQVFTLTYSSRILYVAIAAAAAGFLVVLGVLWMDRKVNAPKETPRQALAWLGLGLASMLLAGPPFWVTGIPLELTFPWDRTSLAFILGVSIFTVGIIRLLHYHPVQIVMLSLLAAFSIAVHSHNANEYRKEWQLERMFFNQLSWRIPAMDARTMLILDYSPFNYHIDKFLAPALNWMYGPDQQGLTQDYMLVDFYKVADLFHNNPSGNEIVDRSYGTLKFVSTLDQSIFIAYAPFGCLHVLDQASPDFDTITPGFEDAAMWSDLNLINTTTTTPAVPPGFFGSPILNDWCFYFEKADLAAQSGEWEEVRQLGKQAQAAGLSPRDPLEWLIFLEAALNTGDGEQAQFIMAKMEPAGKMDSVCSYFKKGQYNQYPLIEASCGQ